MTYKNQTQKDMYSDSQTPSIPQIRQYLEQILLALRKARVLESRRGVHGGYTLARPPEQISVGEVLRAVEGKSCQPSCLIEDSQERHACPEATSCGLRQVWEDLQVTLDRILLQTSFAEVCRRTVALSVKTGELVGLKSSR